MSATPYSIASLIAREWNRVSGTPNKYFGTEIYTVRQMGMIKKAKDALGTDYDTLNKMARWFYKQRASGRYLPWKASTLFTPERFEEFKKWEKAHEHETFEDAVSRGRKGSITKEQREEVRKWTRK